MKNNKLLNLIIFSLFILIFSSVNIFNQNENKLQQETADLMAFKLKQKVILSDEQTAKVKVVLTSYINDFREGNKNPEREKEAKEKISGILTEKQKAKYDIIKDDFFNEVKKEASKN